MRNLPPRCVLFTGRRAALAEIHQRLSRDRGDRGPGATVPLQGMGGVGKTQLALEYAHLHVAEYGVVWWVNADNRIVAVSDLVALARELGLAVDDEHSRVLAALWVLLAGRDDWLLIYDNVDDLQVLAELRPPANGQLLVTGRIAALGRLAAELRVSELERAESLLLLRQRCPRLTEEEAGQIAAALGDLPLALEQAGCFLAETGVSVGDYLELLASQPDSAGLSDPTLDRHPGLAGVVSASRRRLEAIDRMAAVFLDQLAFLAPEPLPVTPRSRGSDQRRPGVVVGDTAMTAATVRNLVSLGLARQTDGALQLHRLVQALLRVRLSPKEQAESKLAAQHLLATAIVGEADNPLSWSTYAALVPHVQTLLSHLPVAVVGGGADPERFRLLLIGVLRYLYVSGQYRAGLSLARTAHTRWTTTLTADHPHTLHAAGIVAATLHGLGDYVGARDVDRDTLERRIRVFGSDHPDTLISASGLATDLFDLGEFEAARDLHQDALARRTRVLGDDHPDTLRSAGSLANDLLSLGNYRAGHDLHQETLALRARVLGTDHPDTLRSASGLAHGLNGLGEYVAACDLFRETLAEQRRVLGADHPDTLRSASGLAHGLNGLGEYVAACDLFRETLAEQRRVLGADHPDTLRSASGLAHGLNSGRADVHPPQC